MDSQHNFILEIFKNIKLNTKDQELIQNEFEEIKITKGTLLLSPNETVLHEYYVSKGCLRAFYIDPLGKEHTLQFAINDWWISDYTAFFSGAKATLHIECISKTAVLYKVSKQSMDTLYQTIPKLETYIRLKMEGAFESFQKRILANLSQTATERYLAFMATYPNIEKHVKNYHIASYLGITNESLSRIRKEIVT